MSFQLMFGLMLICLVIVLVLRYFSGSRKAPKTLHSEANVEKSHRSEYPYEGVSIRCGGKACKSVMAIGAKRFLTADAPHVPLESCTSDNCTCTYIHHKDRRDHLGDRRASMALSTELHEQSGRKERRVQSGRRASDWQAASPTY